MDRPVTQSDRQPTKHPLSRHRGQEEHKQGIMVDPHCWRRLSNIETNNPLIIDLDASAVG